MKPTWRGVYPAATTEFKPDQSLDIPATLRHLEVMIDAGVHGMIMLGTVGENCSLEYREKLDKTGMKYTYFESEGGHTWANWRVYLTAFLPLLFQ